MRRRKTPNPTCSCEHSWSTHAVCKNGEGTCCLSDGCGCKRFVRVTAEAVDMIATAALNGSGDAIIDAIEAAIAKRERDAA